MRVFVAGGSRAIGVLLVRALVGAGYQVTALTRSSNKQEMLRILGARPAVIDALDTAALRTVVETARPTHVVHQLTALPKQGIRRGSALALTNRPRTEGIRNFLHAVIGAGAASFIAGSFALMSGGGFKAPPGLRAAAAAIESMESQVLEATRSGSVAGVVLRYGLFYGPDNPATEKMIELVRRHLLPVIRGDRSLLPCIHLADAVTPTVTATVAALVRGQAGSVYDVVDHQPVSVSEIIRAIAECAGAKTPWAFPSWPLPLIKPFVASGTSIRLPLSNQKARREFGWSPAFPTWRDGVEHMAARVVVNKNG